MSNAYGLNRLLGGAIAVIALVAALSGLSVLATLNTSNDANAARARSNRIMHAVDVANAAMLDQETGLRGYLLTGRKASLEPYEAGRPALTSVLGELRVLFASDPAQEGRLDAAMAAARAWQVDVGEATVARMDNPATRPEAAAIEASGTGKRRFDDFRIAINAIADFEAKALAAQDGVQAWAQHRATVALWLGTSTTLLICGLVAVAIHRLVVLPLTRLADAMYCLSKRELETAVPGTGQRNEVGAMARAVDVFKAGLVELNRTSLLRITADTLPAMVGYVDAQRRVGFLNDEFASWFDLGAGDVSEHYGRRLSQVFSKDPFPGMTELETALKGVETRSEHRLARRGTGRRDVEAFYRPHRDDHGRILGVVTLLTDITERKRMERTLSQRSRTLQRSNEELEQFAYVASHDLKAPLRGIENLIGWIEEDLETVLTADSRTNMDLLKSRVRRLESLLDDLLAYSRAGRTDANVEAVDVAALVDDLALLVSPPEGFAIVGGSGLPTIQSARAPLTQALQNLLGNAIKHHDRPSEGRIMVDAREAGAMIELSVMDDGPGIPEQFRERVFGMFQTLKPRDEVEGSGMGLAIVRKLVERRGGRIWLEGGADGRGLVVRFTWPRDAKGTDDGADG